MRLDLDDFSGGVNTYKDDGQLSSREAREAKDCFVGDGALTPVPEVGSGVPTGIDKKRFDDEDNCGYVEYGGETYSGCDLSGLGLPQPGAPVVVQGDTPSVIGPSEDGSGSFNAAGDWEQTEFVQTNTWTSTVTDTTGDSPTSTTYTATDSWVVCDTPSFNISEYYALAKANPSLAKAPPSTNQYGCVTGSTGGDYSTGPGDEFVPRYFTENTSYAVAFYNEDWDVQSTISNIAEFQHVPYIAHREWSYGPLQGDTDGKKWYAIAPSSGQSGLLPWESTDPSALRGGRRQTVRYTGISHLHQVSVSLPSHHNASHVILYSRVGGSLTPIAKTSPGATLTVRPDGVYEGNGGEDLSLSSDLQNFRPQFTYFTGPPSSLNGIAINSIGIMVGFSGHDIHISQPQSGFHLWNPDAVFTLNHEPLTVHAIYNEFFITTKGKPVKITGSNPATMVPIEMRDLEYNLDWRSAADVGSHVMYAGPNGVQGYDGSSVRPITRGLLSYSDWLAISDSDDLVGVASDEVYILYHDNGSLVVDMRPESQAITTHSLTATKAVYGIEDGYIYLSGGRRWRLHEALTTEYSDTEGVRESGRIFLDNDSLCWMRVFSRGTVEVIIRNEKNHEMSVSVSNSTPFRIGFGNTPVEGEWITIKVLFRHRVTGIQMASRIEELHR